MPWARNPGPTRLHKTSMASCEVPDVCFVWVGSRGPITMLVFRLWYRKELFVRSGCVPSRLVLVKLQGFVFDYFDKSCLNQRNVLQ